LDDFLHYYYIGISVLVNEADYEALAWDYFEHASADGVQHAEVFFDPQAHTSRGIAYETVLSGFQAACSRAQRDLGISTELITCFLRHLPVADSLASFHDPVAQANYASGTIRGIGLDSSESAFPPHLFKEIFNQAASQGVRLTAHAGEEGPVDFIAEALDVLHVQRIDHGIKLVDDAALLQRVTASKVMLTCCPLSNVVLRCVETMDRHPIQQLLNAGVKFSINSDDPAYFDGYILANYCAVQESFCWSVEQWGVVCRNAIQGSWCSEERKSELVDRLEKLLAEYR
jgi:adenosine deaminase